MLNGILTAHPHLAGSGRLRSLTSTGAGRIAATELIVLALAGASAAVAAALVKLGLRMPGHVILYMTLPMALGYSLSPRRGSGAIMAMSAGVVGIALIAASVGRLPMAAWTGLVALGPFIDWAAARSRGGWRWYVSFALCGMAANWVAFGVRVATPLLGLELAGSRDFLGFWPTALASYTLCGLLAGLISSVACFRVSPRTDRAK